MAKTRVRIPEAVKAGEIFEIRAMAIHSMDSGFRLDNLGRTIPRHIIHTFTCSYGGKEIFRAKLYPALTTNPYISFFAVANESADMVFTWIDDHNVTLTETVRLQVRGG